MIREIRVKAIRESHQERLEEAQRAKDTREETRLMGLMEQKIAPPRRRERKTGSAIMAVLIAIVPQVVAALLTNVLSHFFPHLL